MLNPKSTTSPSTGRRTRAGSGNGRTRPCDAGRSASPTPCGPIESDPSRRFWPSRPRAFSPATAAADARDDCNGLCGLVSDLAPATLLDAYGRGLYPFCHLGPLKWWAPRERMVLFFPEFHIAKRLRRQIRNGGYRVTFDRAFADVIRACAKPRAGKAPLT